jgi:CheY-like chemotaxis protein
MEVLKANHVSLVLSDVRMPGGDGVQLLESIRTRDPKLPPVIFVTGFADLSEAECMAKGANRVIAKPFDRKALFRSVCDVLNIPVP